MTVDMWIGRVHIGDWDIDRSEAIFVFIVGMLLGLFFFLFTLRIFDGIIRPKFFPALPSDRNVMERSVRSTGIATAIPTDR